MIPAAVRPNWKEFVAPLLGKSFSFLGYKDVISSGLTCKRWNAIVKTDITLQKIIAEMVGEAPEDPFPGIHSQWKSQEH